MESRSLNVVMMAETGTRGMGGRVLPSGARDQRWCSRRRCSAPRTSRIASDWRMHALTPRFARSWSERVVFLQQHARTAVPQIPDLRFDIALVGNLAMAGVHRRVDADLLQLTAESLRREMSRIVGKRLLIVRKRSLGDNGHDILRFVGALPDLVRRAGIAGKRDGLTVH